MTNNKTNSFADTIEAVLATMAEYGYRAFQGVSQYRQELPNQEALVYLHAACREFENARPNSGHHEGMQALHAYREEQKWTEIRSMLDKLATLDPAAAEAAKLDIEEMEVHLALHLVKKALQMAREAKKAAQELQRKKDANARRQNAAAKRQDEKRRMRNTRTSVNRHIADQDERPYPGRSTVRTVFRRATEAHTKENPGDFAGAIDAGYSAKAAELKERFIGRIRTPEGEALDPVKNIDHANVVQEILQAERGAEWRDFVPEGYRVISVFELERELKNKKAEKVRPRRRRVA